MKYPSHLHRLHGAKGFTLIELLVSVTIGLVLMIAVASAYVGSATASKVAEAQGRMNEDATAALNILTQQIRMAGDNPRRPLFGGHHDVGGVRDRQEHSPGNA